MGSNRKWSRREDDLRRPFLCYKEALNVRVSR